MSDTPPDRPPKAKSPRKGIIVVTVLATLACVLVLEKLLAMVPGPGDQARVQRSKALLAVQQRDGKAYQEYYKSAMADHKRFEALLSRQEKDEERFAKILETWEQQQKLYQAYLDSLRHPQ